MRSVSEMKRRIDSNQPAVVDALRDEGMGWIPTSGDPNIGFDGIVLYQGRALLAEIKDESKPPSARKLTDAEEKRRQQCVSHGVPYLILLNPEQAVRTVRLIVAQAEGKHAKISDEAQTKRDAARALRSLGKGVISIAANLDDAV